MCSDSSLPAWGNVTAVDAAVESDGFGDLELQADEFESFCDVVITEDSVSPITITEDFAISITITEDSARLSNGFDYVRPVNVDAESHHDSLDVLRLDLM